MNASRPDALFAHFSHSFASTVLLFARLCVPVYNSAVRGGSCLSITANGARCSGLNTGFTNPGPLLARQWTKVNKFLIWICFTIKRFLQHKTDVRPSTGRPEMMKWGRESSGVQHVDTYLVQSSKSSLQGLCSSLSRHPATTSRGMSGRWAADLRQKTETCQLSEGLGHGGTAGG